MGGMGEGAEGPNFPLPVSFNPLSPDIKMHFLFTVLQTFSYGTNKENLSSNLSLVITSYILIFVL